MSPTPIVMQISARPVIGDVELLERVERAGSGYWVQLRDPELTGGALLALAERLREATRDTGARLLVNDRLDVARLVGADGVHLGRCSVTAADARRLLGQDVWISRSCHSLDEVERAADDGVALVLLSPIFASPGKSVQLGLEALGEARRRLAGSGVLLVALGGIRLDNAGECLDAGADGVASIRADLGGLLASPRR